MKNKASLSVNTIILLTLGLIAFIVIIVIIGRSFGWWNTTTGPIEKNQSLTLKCIPKTAGDDIDDDGFSDTRTIGNVKCDKYPNDPKRH